MPSLIPSPTIISRSGLAVPLTLLLAVVLLAGCGGPASTVFKSAAPTEALVPYISGSNYAGSASVVGLRGHDGTEAWRTIIGQRDNDAATATVGGVLYIEAVPEATPSPQPPSGSILALRLSDGKILWHTLLPQSDYRVGVTADETTVIAAAGVGGLYALDRATGAIRWHQAVTLSQDLSGAAHLSGDVVLAIQTSAPPRSTATSSGLSAWSESDGRLLWQQSYGAAIATNQLAAYFTLSDSTLALAPQDGHELWSYPSGRTVEGGGADNYHGNLIASGDQLVLVQETYPVVSNDQPTRDYVAALDARGGTLVWKASPGFDGALTFGGPIAIGSGAEATIDGGYRNQLVALHGTDGTQAWKADLSPYTVEQLTHADGVLFALLHPPNCDDFGPCSGPTNKRMEARNAGTGAVYWERDVPDAVVLAGE